MGKFSDGLKDVFSGLINKRNTLNRNQVNHRKLSDEELRVMYKSGLMSKIIRLKAGYALNDTMQFESTADKEFFESRLLPFVKKSSKFMLGFGRGCIVMFNPGDDLSKPLKVSSPENLRVQTFSGDMVSVTTQVVDLQDPRYYKPKVYYVRGEQIHWTRVADFTYFEPVEWERSEYDYGGISESELIYEQFLNDAVVQRATGTIVDKASTFVYKIKGYKDLIKSKREKDVVQYVSTCEDGRSIYGGLITDADDMVEVLSQSITDLDKVDNITLRRIAMVTGLGMTDLVGEQPGGLNANGTDERSNTQDTIENLQSDYLLDPINYLAKMFGLGCISFKDNQGQTPEERIAYEKSATDVAKILWEIGADWKDYLEDKDIIQKDDWDSFWSEGKEQGLDEEKILAEFLNEPIQSTITDEE